MRVGNAAEIDTQEDLGLVLDDFTSMTVDAGDINGDGIVNVLDLSILSANWRATTSVSEPITLSGAATGGVPEPATLVLLGLGGMLLRRRQR